MGLGSVITVGRVSLLLVNMFMLLKYDSGGGRRPVSGSKVPIVGLSRSMSAMPSLLLDRTTSGISVMPLRIASRSLLKRVCRLRVARGSV